MKHTVKNLSDTKVEVTITLDAAELKEAKQIALAKLAKEAKVPGFRAGKVPPSVAEKHLSPIAVENETIENAINTAVVEVFTSQKVQALDRPQVDVKKLVPGESVEFIATTEILPEITLGDYKKLKTPEEKISVTAKEVAEVIDRMRNGFAKKNPVERAAKEGDEVVIDFEGKDDKGELVAGAAGKDYPLTLGSNTFIPGFEEGIIGKKAGETFDLPLTFPKEYHSAQLAGAKVTFTVTLKEVKEVVLPEVDDDFAKQTGSFEKVEDLKADIKRELTAQKEQARDDKIKDSLIEQVVAASKVPVPEILVADQQQALERDMMQNLMYRGMTLEQYLSSQKLTEDEWRNKELKEAAIRRVKVGLVLAELSKAEKIEVATKELEEKLSLLLKQYPDEKMRGQIDTPEARRDIANRLLTEKTLARLVELNK